MTTLGFRNYFPYQDFSTWNTTHDGQLQLPTPWFSQWQIDGLMQKRCNSIANALSYVFLVWTHWGRVTHICVSKIIIIGSDNGLSPGRRQAIIWTNARILSIGPLGTNFSEILFEIQICSFNKMHFEMSCVKWHPFCLGLNVLTHRGRVTHTCVGKLTIIASDNGLSPGRRQAII